MLKIGTKYWIRIIGNNKEVNLKGKVLEEDGFLVKIVRDDGSEEIISKRQILHLNEAKEIETNNFNTADKVETEKINLRRKNE